MHMAKRCLIFGGAIAAVLVLGVGGWWLYVGYKTSPQSWPLNEFSSAAWKAATPEERYVFYRDLATSNRLNGVTKVEVMELLGPPDYEDPRGHSMSYTLKYGGTEEPLFNSIYFLNIELRPHDGRVERYAVRAD
jgi:hypothetical protein